MIRLTDEQIQDHLKLMDSYIAASNASTGATMDPNANITKKTLATMDCEIYKGIKIQVNIANAKRYIDRRFGQDLADQFIKDIESHLIYVHDSSSALPYCVSVSLYPFAIDGMTGLNSDGSDAPSHLASFCGGFQNLVQYIAGQFAGAVATPEFLPYFDYFARKDYGDNYLETHQYEITQALQGVVYLLNQDATARSGQSVFWNASTFDEGFFKGILGDIVMPDMTKLNWDGINQLQKYFLLWLTEERKKKFLTFPIMTNHAICNDSDWEDTDNKKLMATTYSRGLRPFLYTSKTADSLSSCCRLSNKLGENRGVATGSVNVITLNYNRMIQTGVDLEDIVARINKYNLCYHDFFSDMLSKEMMPVYDAGFISIDKQFLTLGVNGFVEGAEFEGHSASLNDEYLEYQRSIFGRIKEINSTMSEEYGVRFGTEIVPAENLGVKNAKWDKADGLVVNGDCYNSYFYRPEEDMPTLDKMILHGSNVCGSLDGGQALHDNEAYSGTFDSYMLKFTNLITTGCNYYTANVKETCCNSCGKNDPDTHDSCPSCGSKDIDYATKIVGYVKRVKAFSEPKQAEEKARHYGE